MSGRNLISTLVLVLLLGIFGRLAYSRAYRVFFSVKPATLAAPYTSEEAWIVDEIVRDITEMGLGTAGGSPTVLAAAQPGTYTVSLAATPAVTTTVDLSAELWSPTGFAALAEAVLATQPSPARAPSGVTVHEGLLDLTTLTLLTASENASRALQADLRDVAAHESAALTLAAFALREPVARQGDTRWAMNRITAHLALAQALRGDTAASVDGRLATAVLLTFTGQQVRAMAALDALDAEAATPAVHAWTRAIRLRITEDWRLLDDPRNATRLEQREYLRARRVTGRNVTGSSELERLGRTMDVDWFRIINGSVVGVEDASLVTEALDQERAELYDIYLRLHGTPLAKDDTAALNALATRCMNGTSPEVLGWGAWAEFGQRRLAAVISRYDSYLRHSLGAREAADEAKVMLHDQLGHLWTFPSATIWWTKGPRGLEADDRYFNEAVSTAVAQPQRVTAHVWTVLEFASRYVQHARQNMPSAPAWFFTTSPRTAYDAAMRIQAGGLRPVQDFDRVMQNAPYDLPLATNYLSAKFGKLVPLEEVERRLGARLAFDTRAVAWAMAAVDEGERSVELLENACGFSPTYCQQFGTKLAMLGRTADAARAFERALQDDAVDDVAKANWSGWLVDYYQSQGRTPAALELAERAASTGAAAGLITAGRLYERLGRMNDAEAAFAANAGRYEAPGELLGFYYRAVVVRKDATYEAAWTRALEQVFPEGLSREPVPAGPPTLGVYVEQDSPAANKLGLQASDVIVAVDGWRVDNMVQYRSVRAFPQSGGFTLTVARGATRIPVTIPDRALVPDFRIANYPVQGWIEK
ncbi:MAG: PDZ domain-containing protein [Vicinamibacterales bacterium]